MENIVVVSGQRTAFGAFGGSLKDVGATALAVAASKKAIEQAHLKTADIDHVIFGNVVQSGADAAYVPRHIGLHLGIPENIPALGLNRLCGSGFQAWISAAQMILTGEANVVLAGGTEQMSQIPYVLRGVRFEGYRMGNGVVEDYMTSALTDAFAKMPMAITAENLAEKYDISRDACDEYSFLTQTRCAEALKKGYFKEEIAAVEVTNKKGTIQVTLDEHPKPDIPIEKIKNLKALFKENGRVTAATASGIVDGAAASILMTESEAKKRGLKPLVKIVSWACVGCDPKMMGIGPVGAIKKALTKANMTLKQMDLVEVNEAFAAQACAVHQEMGWDMSRVNVNGGAIALGHPIGASGARILVTLLHEMQRRDAKKGIASLCIGGGMGVALTVER